jgi:hypothetical protein
MTVSTRTARQIVDRFTALGLVDKLPATIPAHLARSAELSEAARIQRDDTFAAERKAVVSELAAGSLAPDAARDRLIAARSQGDVENLTKDALLAAADRAGRAAAREIENAGETLLTEILAPAAAATVADCAAALESLPDEVTSADQAIRAGSKAANAWGRIVAADERWSALRELVRELRSADVLAGNPHDDFLFVRSPGQEELGRKPLSQILERGGEARFLTEVEGAEQWAQLQAEAAAKREAELAAAGGIKRRSGGSVGGRLIEATEMTRLVDEVNRRTAVDPVSGQALSGGTDPTEDPAPNLREVASSIPRR